MAQPLEAKRIPLEGVSAVWLLIITNSPLSIGSPSGDSDAANRFKFDNLSENGSATIPMSSDEDSGEYEEIAVTGKTTIKFPLASVVLDGTETEDDGSTPKNITPASSASTGNELSININEADIDSAQWTDTLKKLLDNKDKEMLIVVPTGFTYASLNTNGDADGYIYFVGKFSGTINPKAKPPTSLSFQSVKTVSASDSGWSAAVTGLDFSAEPVGEEPGYINRKGFASVHLTPDNLLEADADILKEGNVVIKTKTIT